MDWEAPLAMVALAGVAVGGVVWIIQLLRQNSHV